MPEMQELIEKYARSKNSADYGEIVRLVQTCSKLWTVYSPVTKCRYTEYINGIPSAFIFSEKAFCQDFRKHCEKNNIQTETELCKSDTRIQFFSDLYRCGTERLVLDNGKKFIVMNLSDIIDRPDFSTLPPNERPVMNAELMLNANIFFQSVSSGNVSRSTQKSLLRELYKSRYLMPVMVDRDTKLDGMEESILKAVSSQSGTAVTVVAIKTDERAVIPFFTDWTEFSRFDKDKQCAGNIMTFRDIEYLCSQGEKITINPFGFNMVIDRNAIELIKSVSSDIPPAQQPVQEPVEEYTEPVEEYTEPVEEYAEPAEEYAEPVEEYTEPAEEYTEPVEEYEESDSEEEQVQLFELRSVPHEMITVLMSLMSQTEGINKAYLKGMVQGDVTYYLIIVDFEGDVSELYGISEQAEQYSGGVPVEVVLYASDFGMYAAQSTYPFYQR